MNKITFWHVFRFACIALVVILYWVSSKGPSAKELILQEAALEAFHGTADSIYHQTQNHNTKTVRVSDGHILELWSEWENLIDVGDSLYKLKGSFQIKVLKRSGRVTVLDYKEIVRTFKN
ncbi:hypothetical protein SAMN04487890_107274 [Mucilaginibacter polytrichastri]|nr:hypothetical protein SAMN04487890_107274 [Mucilaginibacter polytrichastri]